MGNYEGIGAYPGGCVVPVEEVEGYIINTEHHSGSLQWFLPMSVIPEIIETSLVLLYVYPFLYDFESASSLAEVLLYRISDR